VRALHAMGHQALYTLNLTGAGSMVGSPREPFADAACNALEAVSAGIGRMARNGCVETQAYGISQRFVAIVTDAPLSPDPVLGGMAGACAGCDICVRACPSAALDPKKQVELSLGGQKVPYLPVEQNRCDWVTRYALSNEDGNAFGGSQTNVPCPEVIDTEALAKALSTHDWVFKFRPVIGESCIVKCPLVKA